MYTCSEKLKFYGRKTKALIWKIVSFPRSFLGNINFSTGNYPPFVSWAKYCDNLLFFYQLTNYQILQTFIARASELPNKTKMARRGSICLILVLFSEFSPYIADNADPIAWDVKDNTKFGVAEPNVEVRMFSLFANRYQILDQILHSGYLKPTSDFWSNWRQILCE